MSSTKPVKPVLKWAGGKRWLVSNYDWLLPDEFECYREPFLGSGAVFFHLTPKRAVLSDANSRLIDCYAAIKSDWEAVWKALQTFERRHSDEFYYEIRQREYPSAAKEAARFIYLNRTCFNGIYRENLKGVFNVPRGTKDSVTFPDDNFRAVSTRLKRSKLFSGDFSENIQDAERDDFVFIDPPYTVRHNNNGFVKYNQKIFSWDDQVRLRDEVKLAAARGAKLLITNAHHSSILELYRGIGEPITLSRSSVISSDPSARGSYAELAIVVGYAVEALTHETEGSRTELRRSSTS
jgi:DNA adenine methylase